MTPKNPYSMPTNEQLEAQASARVEAASTPLDLLRLCVPSVSFDASTGVIGAKDLLAKVQKVLNDNSP